MGRNALARLVSSRLMESAGPAIPTLPTMEKTASATLASMETEINAINVILLAEDVLVLKKASALFAPTSATLSRMGSAPVNHPVPLVFILTAQARPASPVPPIVLNVTPKTSVKLASKDLN